MFLPPPSPYGKRPTPTQEPKTEPESDDATPDEQAARGYLQYLMDHGQIHRDQGDERDESASQ